MSALARRAARLTAEARRLKHERGQQPQRITRVVVHLGGEGGEPMLVHAGLGSGTPALYEVRA